MLQHNLTLQRPTLSRKMSSFADETIMMNADSIRQFLQRRQLIFGLPFVALALILLRVTLSNGQILGVDYGGSLSYWAVWFPWHALQHNLDMAFTDYFFFPVEINIMLLLSPLSTLFYHLLNIVLPSLLAYNLLFPIYVALTGWLTFLFARRYIQSDLFALAAALVIAFNPLSFSLAEDGSLILLGWFVFPLWLLAWMDFLENPRGWALVRTLAATYLVILMALQFSNLMLTFLLPLAAWQFRESETEWDQIVDYLVLGGVILIVLLLIHPLTIIFRATYIGAYGPFVSQHPAISVQGTAWTLFLWGGTALILLAVSLWDDAGRLRWLMVIGINAAIYTVVELAPLTLLSEIFNVPNAPELTPRALFLLPIIFCGSVMVFQWLAELELTGARRMGLYATMVAVIFGGSGWWQDLPTTTVRDYEFYRNIASDPENYLVIDVPVTQPRTLVYAPTHHKRTPSQIFNDPLYLMLAGLDMDGGDPLDIQHDSLALRAAYVVIYRDEFTPLTAGGVDSVRGWLEWSGAYCLGGVEDDIEYWRAAWHPAGCVYAFSMGGPASDLAVGDGWWPGEDSEIGRLRWAGQGTDSHLTLWAFRPAGDYVLTFRAATLAEIDGQRVEVVVNNESLGEFDLQTDFSEFRVTVPRELIGARGLLEVELRHDEVLTFEGRELAAIYESMELVQQN
jgi:hypothetical protein